MNWDKFELIENNQGSDGGGPDDLYYLSYFWPVAKSDRVGRTIPTGWMMTTRGAHRQDVVFHRTCGSEGVLDRYMRVYHPRADGAPTPHTVLEFADAGSHQGHCAIPPSSGQ